MEGLKMQKNSRREYRKHDHEYWSIHISAWQKSGISQKEYCRQNNIPLTSFGNWKRKINIGFVDSSSFIELKGHFPAQEECFELQTGSGLTLRIRESIEPELLQNILIAARGM
jgi:hypothetical protein